MISRKKMVRENFLFVQFVDIQSHKFWQNFVKVMFLTIQLLKTWFDGKIFWWHWIFPQFTVYNWISRIILKFLQHIVKNTEKYFVKSFHKKNHFENFTLWIYFHVKIGSSCLELQTYLLKMISRKNKERAYATFWKR